MIFPLDGTGRLFYLSRRVFPRAKIFHVNFSKTRGSVVQPEKVSHKRRKYKTKTHFLLGQFGGGGAGNGGKPLMCPPAGGRAPATPPQPTEIAAF